MLYKSKMVQNENSSRFCHIDPLIDCRHLVEGFFICQSGFHFMAPCSSYYMNGSWNKLGQNLFFSFGKFSHSCWKPELIKNHPWSSVPSIYGKYGNYGKFEKYRKYGKSIFSSISCIFRIFRIFHIIFRIYRIFCI